MEKMVGLIDCLYNEDHAFQLVQEIKRIEDNKVFKKKSLLEGMYERLTTYCQKYNRSINTVIRDYESSQQYAC